jgi:hypothetical protein
MFFMSVAAKNMILRMIGVMTVAGTAMVTVDVINESFVHAQLPKPAAPPVRQSCAQTARGCASATTSVGREDYFSRTIVNEPGRAAGCTSHPAFSVTLQPSPLSVVPSSDPVTGTDSVAPPIARKTPPSALRRPH